MDIQKCRKDYKTERGKSGKPRAIPRNVFDHPVKCPLCEKHFYNMDVHHIDGNHNNDIKKNRILICKSCHGKIHNPKKRQVAEEEQ